MATIISHGPLAHERLVNVCMWGVQVLLATVFAGAGIVELSLPAERLAESMPVSEAVPLLLVRIVGALQMLAALALMLPTASRVLTRVAAVAAAGLTVLMLATSMVHALRGELSALPITLSLALLATYCAWARLRLPDAGEA